MSELELGILIATAVVWLIAATRRRRPRRRRASGLDTVLFWWNQVDAFTRRMLLEAGVLIMGRPGSGKTSGSGMRLARAIVRDAFSSLLILAAKPEDGEMWRKIFRECNRELIEVAPGGPMRCNMIEFIQKIGGDATDIVNCLLIPSEVLGTDGKGGEGGQFFDDAKRRFLHFDVEILRQAGAPITAPNIQSFINTAALSKEQQRTQSWKEQFHCQAFQRALERKKTDREKHDFENARAAWLQEWPTMADKTRSSIAACMANILFYWSNGLARELIGTETTVSPFTLLARNGASILVNCPPCQFGLTGALAATTWKYATQRLVLARGYDPNEHRYNVIWADEAWQVTTSFDQHYAATSRSHGGAMVYLVQGRDSFYSAMNGEKGKHYADGLMAMFSHRIFHSLSSPADAEWAAAGLGKKREAAFGGSMQPADLYDTAFGQSQFSGSFSTSWQNVLQPRVFLSGLRCGGHEGVVDGIVVRSGEPFHSTGQNWIHATFSQR